MHSPFIGAYIVEILALTKVVIAKTISTMCHSADIVLIVSAITASVDKHYDLRVLIVYSKTCVKRPLSKRPKIGFQDQLSLNAGKKYCRMLQGEHSAILSTFNKLPFVIKIFVWSIFEWPLYTGFYCTP